MKIAIFGPKNYPIKGGIDNFCIELSTRLQRKGHKIIIYTRSYRIKPFKKYKYNGVNIISSPGISGKNFEAITHTFFSVLHAMLTYNFDVYYFHSIGLAIFGVIPKLFGKKIILHVHGLDWKRSKWSHTASYILKTISKWFLRYYDKVLVVSHHDKRSLEEHVSGSIEIISTGVSIDPKKYNIKEHFPFLEENDYILFFSRLTPEKGCHRLLAAYNHLETSVQLVIAGWDENSIDYIDALHDKKTDNVHFTGFVLGSKAKALLSNCLLLVQPSDLEGLSHSVLQAFSYGKCVLASNNHGNVEALNKLGYYFDLNKKNEINKRLSYLLRNRDEIFNGSKKRIEFVKNKYNWNTKVDQLDKTLKRMKQCQY